MDFVLWACRVVHIVSVVAWVGGLIFLNAVVKPIVEYDKASRSALNLKIQKQFLPFIWSSLWPLLVTGILLMLLSPRFLWFDYSTLWSKLLAAKQICFLLLLFFSWQVGKVLTQLEQAVTGDPDVFEGWWLAYSKLLKRSLVVAIVAILCSAGMMVV
ncbi:MAG: hypothetical protein L0Y80_04395 [Ignavibacteriae bacterium]|nr:hypothetical protein [Ignavibacteriota bacterium]